jgi:hypothetical protein
MAWTNSAGRRTPDGQGHNIRQAYKNRSHWIPLFCIHISKSNGTITDLPMVTRVPQMVHNTPVIRTL